MPEDEALGLRALASFAHLPLSPDKIVPLADEAAARQRQFQAQQRQVRRERFEAGRRAGRRLKSLLSRQSLNQRLLKRAAGMGRGGDTEIGPLTPGEIVLPKGVLDAETLARLKQRFVEAGLDMGRYTVGGDDDSINPATGAREFYEGDGGWGEEGAGWGDMATGDSPAGGVGGSDAGAGAGAGAGSGNADGSNSDLGGGNNLGNADMLLGGKPSNTPFGENDDPGADDPFGHLGETYKAYWDDALKKGISSREAAVEDWQHQMSARNADELATLRAKSLTRDRSNDSWWNSNANFQNEMNQALARSRAKVLGQTKAPATRVSTSFLDAAPKSIAPAPARDSGLVSSPIAGVNDDFQEISFAPSIGGITDLTGQAKSDSLGQFTSASNLGITGDGNFFAGMVSLSGLASLAGKGAAAGTASNFGYHADAYMGLFDDLTSIGPTDAVNYNDLTNFGGFLDTGVSPTAPGTAAVNVSSSPQDAQTGKSVDDLIEAFKDEDPYILGLWSALIGPPRQVLIWADLRWAMTIPSFRPPARGRFMCAFDCDLTAEIVP